MNRRLLLSRVLGAMAGGARAAAQSGYVPGVFVHTAGGPVELIAYADRTGIGQLRMSSGTFEDVPAIAAPSRLLCNLPSWKPVLVWISTRRIFKDEFAERRNVPFAVRPLGVATLELRVASMEDPARIRTLRSSVQAAEDNPAYLFVTLSNGTITREYMVEVIETQ